MFFIKFRKIIIISESETSTMDKQGELNEELKLEMTALKVK
jgi:hypothetical protein